MRKQIRSWQYVALPFVSHLALVEDSGNMKHSSAHFSRRFSCGRWTAGKLAQTTTIQQINDLLTKKPVISARMAGTWIQIPLLPALAERWDSDSPIFLTALDRLHQKHHCSFQLLHYHNIIMLSQSYLQIGKTLEKHLQIQAVGKKWHGDKNE